MGYFPPGALDKSVLSDLGHNDNRVTLCPTVFY